MAEGSIMLQTTRAAKSLESAYIRGEIAYPRVAHNYMKLTTLKFYEYPHPPLHTFNPLSEPLNEPSYPLDKRTLPLYLTHLNIATPATLVRNLAFIDNFIDDDFYLKASMQDIEETLAYIMEKFREDALFLYSSDVALGLIAPYEGDEEEMRDEELLNIVSSDGEVTKSFDMQITPYSIVLRPTLEFLNEKNNEVDYSKEGREEGEKSKRSCYKVNIDPLSNYEKEATHKSIKVAGIDNILLLEKKVLSTRAMIEKSTQAAIYRTHQGGIDG